jgi:hypothetical protein
MLFSSSDPNVSTGLPSCTPTSTLLSRQPTGWLSSTSMLLPFSALRPGEVRLVVECPSRTRGTWKSIYGLQLVRWCVRWVCVVAGLQDGGRGALDTRYSARRHLGPHSEDLVLPPTLLAPTICFDKMNIQGSGRLWGCYTFKSSKDYIPCDFGWILSLCVHHFAVNVERYMAGDKSTRDRQALDEMHRREKSLRGCIALRMQHHNDRILQPSYCLWHSSVVRCVYFLQLDGEGTNAEFASMGL